MNEQLKELAYQSGFLSKLAFDNSWVPNPNLEAKLKKFSELLEKDIEAKHFSAGYIEGRSDGTMETVRECMTICEDVTERNDPAIACYYDIKQRFGVER